ncbi:MAG TPA: RsmE family RNA methyltransferase [Candidatus Dojkabacteria bacterium]|nr:RsmE family RNA methyltransferase [Candidatus Dojkabacteria bacterium]
MQKYYIPHELKAGDITHLADNDSKIAIADNIKVEDIVEIETYSHIFSAIVTDISKNSVEVEILEKKSDRKGSTNKNTGGISLIQSILNHKKFTFLLEKSVELGINAIYPLHSELSLTTPKEFNKNRGLYNKVISDACEQSRNPYPTILKDLTSIDELKNLGGDGDIKLCLATEDPKAKNLKEIILSKDIKGRNIYIAIGPESGWSLEDIKTLKQANFEFVKLKGNILRTETTGIVVGSIIQFVRGNI